MNIHEAKTRLSRLLQRVAEGQGVTIARAGTPAADLVPHRARPVVLGTAKGRVHCADDFDAPDARITGGFEGRG